MKRLHINVAVTDLDNSVRFYSVLFRSQPTVLKDDYAKWMLDDPRVNFAISTRGARKGLDHLGIQVEDAGELAEVHDRLKSAGAPLLEQGETTCCYAVSEKNWVFDPEGLAWETFLPKGESTVYGKSTDTAAPQSACCATPTDAGAQARTQAAGCGAGAPKSACCG